MLYPALLAVKVPRLLLPRADTLEAATEAALAGGFRAPMGQGVLRYLLGACSAEGEECCTSAHGGQEYTVSRAAHGLDGLGLRKK